MFTTFEMQTFEVYRKQQERDGGVGRVCLPKACSLFHSHIQSADLSLEGNRFRGISDVMQIVLDT